MTNTNEEVGGWQTGGVGRFPRPKREAFHGSKIDLLEFGVSIWILAPHIWVWALYIWILAPYIWILAPKSEMSVFRKGNGGGWVGPSGPPGGFVIGVGKKSSVYPWFFGDDQITVSKFFFWREHFATYEQNALRESCSITVAVQCRHLLVSFFKCPRWAPTASFAWFCILIVLLYLFPSIVASPWRDRFVQIYGGTTLFKAKFGTILQKRHQTTKMGGYLMLRINPSLGNYHSPIKVTFKIVFCCHGPFTLNSESYLSKIMTVCITSRSDRVWGNDTILITRDQVETRVIRKPMFYQ